MEEPFVIDVNYKGMARAFEARLQVYGYSHRFHVDVGGVEILFERDEEGSYRAMVPDPGTVKVPESGLLQAIAEAIERILA